jgi:hypothetical protein
MPFAHSLSKDSVDRKDSIRGQNKPFDTYCNERFGYCIDYPARFLTQQHESQSGDGTDFMNDRNEVVLTVWGRRNEDTEGNMISLETQFSNDVKEVEKAGGQVSYKKLGKAFYVLSGEINRKIFYRKITQKKDAFAFAILEYKPEERSIYDTLASSIYKSFR